MKTTEITAIVMFIIITVLACFSLAYAEDYEEFYPKLAVVTGYEHIEGTEEWIIYLTDKNGEEWSSYGEVEDVCIGILFNMPIWNTNNIKTDEIIEVYYEGYLSVTDMINFLL